MSYILYQIWHWIVGVAQGVVDAFINLPRQILDAVVQLLPDGIVNYFTDTIDVAALASIVADVTWIIPFWGVMAIYVNCYALIASVRLIRWVLAFVPTIGG